MLLYQMEKQEPEMLVYPKSLNKNEYYCRKHMGFKAKGLIAEQLLPNNFIALYEISGITSAKVCFIMNTLNSQISFF